MKLRIFKDSLKSKNSLKDLQPYLWIQVDICIYHLQGYKLHRYDNSIRGYNWDQKSLEDKADRI